MKLARRSRFAIALLCALVAAPVARADDQKSPKAPTSSKAPTSAPTSAKGPSTAAAADDGLPLPPQARSSDSRIDGPDQPRDDRNDPAPVPGGVDAPVAGDSRAPSDTRGDVTRAPADRRGDQGEVAIQNMRKRASDLRKKADELQKLHDTNPAEFERRLRSENAALDARGVPSGTSGLGGQISKVSDTIDGRGPEETIGKSGSRAPRDGRTPVGDVPSIPTDARTPVGGVNPGTLPQLPMGGTAGSTNPNAQPMPWWQTFLVKLLEVCGAGLMALMGRHMGELDNSRASIVNGVAANDPSGAVVLDQQLKGAISDGWTNGSSKVNIGRAIDDQNGLMRPPASSSNTTKPYAPASAPTWNLTPGGNGVRFPTSPDPVTGQPRAVVDLPMGGP